MYRTWLSGGKRRHEQPYTGWRDLTGDLSRSPAPAASPTLTWAAFQGNIYAWLYSNAATSSRGLQASFHLDHDIVPGSSPYVHIHTSPGSAGQTGDVVWVVEWTIAKGHGQEAYGSSLTTKIVCPTSATDRFHQITEVQETRLASHWETDALMHIFVYRDTTDPDDDRSGSQFCNYVDIHYLSRRTVTGTKTIPFDE